MDANVDITDEDLTIERLRYGGILFDNTIEYTRWFGEFVNQADHQGYDVSTRMDFYKWFEEQASTFLNSIPAPARMVYWIKYRKQILNER